MVKTQNTETEAPDARNRLVMSALRLFAERGFEAASTREICEAAETNISAIRYYFGDKAGLYRAVFTESVCDSKCDADTARYLNLPLTEALPRFFMDFLEPLKKGEAIRLVMKLHFREMVEPTGMSGQECGSNTKPHHDILLAMLTKHFALQDIDADVHRLAFATLGMAVHFYVGQTAVSAIAPQLLNTPEAIEVLALRLASYAISMIEGEAQRRTQESS